MNFLLEKLSRIEFREFFVSKQSIEVTRSFIHFATNEGNFFPDDIVYPPDNIKSGVGVLYRYQGKEFLIIFLNDKTIYCKCNSDVKEDFYWYNGIDNWSLLEKVKKFLYRNFFTIKISEVQSVI